MRLAELCLSLQSNPFCHFCLLRLSVTVCLSYGGNVSDCISSGWAGQPFSSWSDMLWSALIFVKGIYLLPVTANKFSISALLVGLSQKQKVRSQVLEVYRFLSHRSEDRSLAFEKHQLWNSISSSCLELLREVIDPACPKSCSQQRSTRGMQIMLISAVLNHHRTDP